MIINISIAKIDSNPWQTRVMEPDPEYIKELALDIACNGLLQIPIGRRIDDNRVQLAFGHNRWKAYQWLYDPENTADAAGNYSVMQVDIRDLSDEQMAVLAWSENEKRRDHTPIERARAIQKRIEDFGWTNRQCAEHLGIDHSTVSNILRLLKLPEGVQQYLLEGKLTERQAEAMLPIYDVPEGFDKNINPWVYGTYLTPNTIGKTVVEQGWPSDMIREKVNNYFQYASKNLKDAEFKLDQLFTENNGIYCGLCKTCDKRMPSRNLCFDKDCFAVKTERVHQDYLHKASFVLGYPLDDPNKGGYPTQLPTYDKESREKIIASKCQSLVLVYRKGAKDFDAFPDAALVCTKRNNSCSCIKGLQELGRESYNAEEHLKEMADIPDEIIDEGDEDIEEETPAPVISEKVISSTDLEEAARQARRKKIEVNKARKDIREKLAARLMDDLNKLEPGAFYVATQGLYPYKVAFNLHTIFDSLARDGARRIIDDYHEFNSIDDLTKYINQCLEKLNLMPFSLEGEPVEVIQQENVLLTNL
jgi:ParB/RepB/Spo0J family partition protein